MATKKKHHVSYADFKHALIKEVKVMLTDTNHEGWAKAIVHTVERMIEDLSKRDPKDYAVEVPGSKEPGTPEGLVIPGSTEPETTEDQDND